MHNPYCYLDSICPQDPAKDPNYPKKEAPMPEDQVKLEVSVKDDIVTVAAHFSVAASEQAIPILFTDTAQGLLDRALAEAGF